MSCTVQWKPRLCIINTRRSMCIANVSCCILGQCTSGLRECIFSIAPSLDGWKLSILHFSQNKIDGKNKIVFGGGKVFVVLSRKVASDTPVRSMCPPIHKCRVYRTLDVVR